MSELQSQALPMLPLRAVANGSGKRSGLVELLGLSVFPPNCIPVAMRNVAGRELLRFLCPKPSGGL